MKLTQKSGIISLPPSGSIILANLLVMALALLYNWNLYILLWSYWLQSVIIGIFHFIKILRLKEFSAKKFTINGKSAARYMDNPAKLKRMVAGFFILHYGAFHFFYLFFLVILSVAGPGDVDQFLFIFKNLKYVLLNGIIFALHYFYEMIVIQPDSSYKPNIGWLMFEPYVRIFPMHLTIILLFFSVLGQKLPVHLSNQNILLIFLGLKFFGDLGGQWLARKKHKAKS